MEEQNSKSLETEVISDIQNYLASFNKEIQDGTTSGSHIESSGLDDQKQSTATCYVTQVSNGSHLEEFHCTDQTENEFTGTTYYATSDGALYASSHQPDGNQQISFHTLASTSDSQSTSSHSGLQQIVLAVSEANGLTFGGTKEISVAIPTSISSQVEQIHRRKQVLTTAESMQSENNEDHPTFIAMQPGAPNESQLDEPVPTQEENLESISVEDSQGLQDPSSQPHAIMVVQQPNITGNEQIVPLSETGNGSTIVTGVGEELHIDDERTLQMMANLAEQAAAKVSGNSNNPVILNAGNSYQTVTIVPSDTNPGEVSYVLIVSQAEDVTDKCDENMDMSVYDFSEGDRHSEGLLTEEITPDGTKMRTIRISPRKSQIATQAHMCNYCNYTSPKRYLLSRHMKSHSEERPHKCSVCERGFKTVASLQNHVNTHTGTRPHLCKDCDACFTTSGELVRHVRYKHTHEKPHRCSECDYASVELSKLKRHMRCHTGERPYQCPHCTYASPDTYKLKRHLRIHTGEKPYECDVCQARFTQSNSLKAHKLIHSGNKPVFHCQFCPTTCGRKTDLRIHIQKLHSNDKPHKCKRCGKTFPDRYSYKLHAKSHEGEKCFKCDLCPYASVNHRHLESHMLIHTDQKPFQCDECGQSFRQKQLLKRHKNLYHDPNYIPPVPKEKTHECSECGKAFRHKGNLIRHLAIHDPEASAAERAEAMRIGEPKAPGEPQDGEEDDYIYDDDLEEGKDGQQVVVFEVIQLPSANGSGLNGQTLTMADGQTVTLAGGEPQGFTIIQQVGDNSGEMDNISGSVCESEDGEISSPVRSVEQVDVALNTNPSPAPRRRGRPRKYPLLSDNHPSVTNQTSAKLDLIHDHLDKSTRHIRKKKIHGTALPEEIYVPHNPVRRGRPPKSIQRSPRIVQIVAKNKDEETSNEVLSSLTVVPDPDILIKREQEMVRRRLEQKQKDMEECFGFNDNDDDSILGMTAAPSFQTFHTNSVEQTS